MNIVPTQTDLCGITTHKQFYNDVIFMMWVDKSRLIIYYIEHLLSKLKSSVQVNSLNSPLYIPVCPSGYTAEFAAQLATTTYESALQSLTLSPSESQVFNYRT